MALALILAAGSGQRLGADRPKGLIELAGRPLVQWSLDLLCAAGGIDRVVVALPPGLTTLPPEIATPAGTICVEGGAVRSASVAHALEAAGPGDPEDMIVVHDAARPLASAELVRAALDTLAGTDALDAAIAAAPVTDTIKRAQEGVVIETLDRSSLWAVQTPQVFRRAALERALDVPPAVLAQATDDAWLVERLGGQVGIVRSGSENLKITTPLDLALAELLLARRA